MKILHLISGGDTGGAKTHVFALLSAIVGKADVKIVCFTKGTFYDELQKIPVSSELIEQKNRTDMSVLIRLKQIIDEGYDIIHCHGARANFIAAALKRKGVKLPFITTIHSDYLLDFDGIYRKVIFTSLNVYSLKKFDYYIAVSSNFKNMLISRGFRPNSVFTVYNGMDYSSPMNYCSKEEFAARIGIEYDPSKTYIGIVGRHDKVKGHDIFLKAAKIVCDNCPNIRFLIAGDGDGREDLVKLCNVLGISDKVTFCGFIKDIYSFINFIDINTLTSRCESFPYVLMEGARMKKPTVSSRVGGIPDLILEGECGLLFKSENYKELAEKLIFLVNHKDIAEAYGENLYRRATSTFSSEKLADSHINIYKSVISDYYSKRRYDVSISGYYGFRNCGDDALLHAIINDLNEQKPDIRINVFSARPRSTRKEYEVDSSFRFNFITLNRKLQSSRMLINGGGSLIQDATSSKSLWYYLYVMYRAYKQGCKIFVYANGIGPIKDRNLKLAGRITDLADIITLREESSLNELTRMGISQEKAKVTADPAISLKGASDTRIYELLGEIGIDSRRKIIGVSVRDWPRSSPNFFPGLAEVLDSASKEFDAQILFVPMKTPDDIKASQKVISIMKTKAYIASNKMSYDEVIGVISKTYLMIGMRLHTLIFSVAAGVPTIGMVYDPKITGFLDYAGMAYSVDSEKFDKICLYDSVREIFEDYEIIKANVEKNSKELSDKAKATARLAVELLEECDR